MCEGSPAVLCVSRVRSGARGVAFRFQICVPTLNQLGIMQSVINF